MEIIFNNKEKYIIYAALGFFIGALSSLMLSLHFYNDIKKDYNKQIEESYIKGLIKGKKIGENNVLNILKERAESHE